MDFYTLQFLHVALLAGGLHFVTAQREGDLRLVGGPSDFQGTVAVYHNQTWGSICDDGWGFSDGNVICKQLGFLRARYIYTRAYYGEAPGPIWIDNLACPHNAESILNCTPTVKDWGRHNCKKNEDAGVDCLRKTPQKPLEMPLRLSCPKCVQNGTCSVCPKKPHPSPDECSPQVAVEGILFASYNNQWMPVSGRNWNMQNAQVACGELGYPLALGIPTLEELWPNWNGEFLKKYNNCGAMVGSGTMLNVPNYPKCAFEEERNTIILGPDCNQLEIAENQRYGEGLKRTMLQKVQCTGRERRLLDCYFPEFGPHGSPLMEVAMVRCGFKPHQNCGKNATSETYRLRGAAVSWKGRVEVKVNGVWGTVCDRLFDAREANIVCRAMGYGTSNGVFFHSFYGYGVGPIHYTRLGCYGNESTLADCVKKRTGAEAERCGHRSDAGIICNSPSMCSNLQRDKVRLIDVPKQFYTYLNDSYVQLQTFQGWGVVCSSSFTMEAATVICREKRQMFAREIQSGTLTNYKGSRYYGFMGCSGEEASISECRILMLPTTTCADKGGDAIVDCALELPDLVPDLLTATNSFRYYPYIHISPMYYLQCAREENCLSSSAVGQPNSALRSLLRFSSLTMNWGRADFLPNRQRHEWEYHTCHRHYHSFETFIHYDLLNTTSRQKVAEGHKASFCLEDSLCKGGYRRFSCSHSQGISRNCGDMYHSGLDCQWIDVTGVGTGLYTVRFIVNPDHLVPETDFKNNQIDCDIELLPETHSLKFFGCKLSDH